MIKSNASPLRYRLKSFPLKRFLSNPIPTGLKTGLAQTGPTGVPASTFVLDRILSVLRQTILMSRAQQLGSQMSYLDTHSVSNHAPRSQGVIHKWHVQMIS